jgi:phospholipid transport system substrate-binding protein
MKRLRLGLLVAVFLYAFSMSSLLKAGEPTEQLSATINDFVVILTSTPVAELRANGLPDRALKLIFARFDFAEMTKLSLGSHWQSLDPAEQRDFIDAFTHRLLVFYGRTMHSYNGETVQFEGEVPEGKQVTVKTKVVSNGREDLPIDYRLHDVDGQWKVYDVVIAHVSVVNNYRAQFERVIAKSSVRDLLQKLKDLQEHS